MARINQVSAGLTAAVVVVVGAVVVVVVDFEDFLDEATAAEDVAAHVARITDVTASSAATRPARGRPNTLDEVLGTAKGYWVLNVPNDRWLRLG
jgi:hypothetical protein